MQPPVYPQGNLGMNMGAGMPSMSMYPPYGATDMSAIMVRVCTDERWRKRRECAAPFHRRKRIPFAPRVDSAGIPPIPMDNRVNDTPTPCSEDTAFRRNVIYSVTSAVKTLQLEDTSPGWRTHL